jgi:hypothetical protein
MFGYFLTIASISSKSFTASSTSAAPAFSFRYFLRFVPGIGIMLSLCAITHAMANRAGEQFLLSANSANAADSF